MTKKGLEFSDGRWLPKAKKAAKHRDELDVSDAFSDPLELKDPIRKRKPTVLIIVRGEPWTKQYDEAINLIKVVAYGEEISFPDEDRAKTLLKELNEQED